MGICRERLKVPKVSGRSILSPKDLNIFWNCFLFRSLFELDRNWKSSQPILQYSLKFAKPSYSQKLFFKMEGTPIRLFHRNAPSEVIINAARWRAAGRVKAPAVDFAWNCKKRKISRTRLQRVRHLARHLLSSRCMELAAHCDGTGVYTFTSPTSQENPIFEWIENVHPSNSYTWWSLEIQISKTSLAILICVLHLFCLDELAW